MSDLKKTIADLDPIDEVNLTDNLVFSQTGVDGKGSVNQLFDKLENQYFNSNFQDNFIGVVQSIQNGKVNLTTNQSEVLTESSGVITLNASSVTFRCNIGDGYSDMGKKAVRLNLNENLTEDISSESDGDYYIYLVYDKTAKTVSLGYSQILRVMSTTPPSHQNGLIWYDIQNNKVFESDGADWTQVYKLLLGMINKSGTTYTIYNRAFNDFAYFEDSFISSVGQQRNYEDNIFTYCKDVVLDIKLQSAGYAYFMKSQSYQLDSTGKIYGWKYGLVDERQSAFKQFDFTDGSGNSVERLIMKVKRSF